MSRAKQHYLDGVSDGFEAAINQVIKFTDAIYDTSQIYSQGYENQEEKHRLKFAMNTLQALRDQLEDVSLDSLDKAAEGLRPKQLELTELTEDEWNEIDSAVVFQKSLLTLLDKYKAEGYVAATLDKFAALVIGGHAAWKEEEE